MRAFLKITSAAIVPAKAGSGRMKTTRTSAENAAFRPDSFPVLDRMDNNVLKTSHLAPEE
jgi:hypothetical protein